MRPAVLAGAAYAVTIVLVCALAPSNAQTSMPQVTPAPASSAFPTIGRTRSKRYCAVETDRVNGAITVTLTNDSLISAGIARLRNADLDRPDITLIDREKVMRELRSVAAAIQINMRAGDAQIADLRALSVKEPDAARSPELKHVADQLDDVLTRQRTVGADLAKMLTIVEGRYAGAQGGLAAAGVMPESNSSRASNGIGSIDQRAAHDPLNRLFGDVADEFGERSIQIGKSEDAAAVHAPKAVNGC